jgi:hypothetical protein
MKNKYILLILLAIPLYSIGGGIRINLQSGYGNYSMTDLKIFNDLMIQNLPFPVRQMENFPGYWYYQGSVEFAITKNLNLGPVYAYHSTGSRLSLADYSGSYAFDHLIHSHQAGLAIDYKLFSKNNFSLYVYTNGGFVFSNVKMNEVLQMTEPEETTIENLSFKSTGYFTEPGISFGYTFKFIEPGIQIGYHIPLSEKGLVNTNNDQKLYLNDGGQVKPGWGGIRIGLSVGIYLPVK